MGEDPTGPLGHGDAGTEPEAERAAERTNERSRARRSESDLSCAEILVLITGAHIGQLEAAAENVRGAIHPEEDEDPRV